MFQFVFVTKKPGRILLFEVILNGNGKGEDLRGGISMLHLHVQPFLHFHVGIFFIRLVTNS